jgi:Zn finger protein HypA/HybF involved in hydrogenase expression
MKCDKCGTDLKVTRLQSPHERCLERQLAAEREKSAGLERMKNAAQDAYAAALAAQKAAEERAERAESAWWRLNEITNVVRTRSAYSDAFALDTIAKICDALAPQAPAAEPCKTCDGRGSVVVGTTMIGELRGQCPRCKATGLEPAAPEGSGK